MNLRIVLVVFIVLVQALALFQFVQPPVAHAAVGVPEILKDINPIDGSNITNFVALGDTVIFHASDADHGGELWRTDGTTAGTVLIKDIYPGPDNSQATKPIIMGDHGYFYAEDVSGEFELWKTDGTEAGTVKLTNISDDGGNFGDFCGVMGERLYFTINDGTNGMELWKTDGTTLGAEMVVDLYPGSDGSNPGKCTVNGNELYFAAQSSADADDQGLWKSDGTEAGTELVKGGGIGVQNVGNDGNKLTIFKSDVYFTFSDPTYGKELWKSDGTLAGTVMVKDIDTTGGSDPEKAVVAGDYLYFSAQDDTYGKELWKTDGTEAGTVLLKDIDVGTGGSFVDSMTAVYNHIYFSADDGAWQRTWVSDGTTAGTRLLSSISNGDVKFGQEYTTYGDTVFFRGTTDAGSELWQTNGTVAGTSMVADIVPGTDGSSPSWLFIHGQILYFRALTPDGHTALYKMDLPTADTTDLNDDGMPDGLQPNIAGYTDPISGKTVVIDAGPGCEITSYNTVSETSLPAPDAGYRYPNGLFDFAGNCGDAGFTTAIKLYLYDTSKDGLVLRKFNPSINTYATVLDAVLSEATINGHTVTVVSYSLTDGGPLDMDGASNGSFEDPVGLAAVVGVPNTGFAQTSPDDRLSATLVLSVTLLIATALTLRTIKSKIL